MPRPRRIPTEEYVSLQRCLPLASRATELVDLPILMAVYPMAKLTSAATATMTNPMSSEFMSDGWRNLSTDSRIIRAPAMEIMLPSMDDEMSSIFPCP